MNDINHTPSRCQVNEITAHNTLPALYSEEIQQKTNVAILQDQMSIEGALDQVHLINKVMSKVMKDGLHYGLIPGCGKKKVLYKAGAEALAFTFRLSEDYEITETKHDGGHREYRIVATITHINSNKVFSRGVGSCSTLESKYCHRDNPADYYNTVLKMAKKRAFVDGIISATSVSDIFTQDIEDMDENGAAINNDNSSKKSYPTSQESSTNGLISDKQIGFARKLMTNYSTEEFKAIKDELIKEDPTFPKTLEECSRQQAKVLIDKLKFTKENKKIIEESNDYLEKNFENGGL